MTPPAPVAAIDELRKSLRHERDVSAAQSARAVLMQTVQLLPVRLMEHELLDFGQRLAQVDSDIATHNLHAEAVETALDSERSRLAGIVRNKAEPRDVECLVVGYFKTNRVTTIRQDTGEAVPGTDRAMRADERQDALDLEVQAQAKPPPPAAPAPDTKKKTIGRTPKK